MYVRGVIKLNVYSLIIHALIRLMMNRVSVHTISDIETHDMFWSSCSSGHRRGSSRILEFLCSMCCWCVIKLNIYSHYTWSDAFDDELCTTSDIEAEDDDML